MPKPKNIREEANEFGKQARKLRDQVAQDGRNADMPNTKNNSKSNLDWSQFDRNLSHFEGIIERKNGIIFGTKSPDSVIAVYDLFKELVKYTGPISKDNDTLRWNMCVGLQKNLTEWARAPGSDNPSSTKYESAVEQFKSNVTETMNKNFKWLVAEPTLWNAIKDVINDVCKFIGIKPAVSLTTNEVLKNKDIKDRFEEIVHKGVKIDAAAELDTEMKPGPGR